MFIALTDFLAAMMCPLLPYLPSGHVFGFVVELIDVGAERLEVRDDKLLPEGLGEQDNVALHTSESRKPQEALEPPYKTAQTTVSATFHLEPQKTNTERTFLVHKLRLQSRRRSLWTKKGNHRR